MTHPTERGRPRHLSGGEARSERRAGTNTAEFFRDSAQKSEECGYRAAIGPAGIWIQGGVSGFLAPVHGQPAGQWIQTGKLVGSGSL